MAKGLFDLTGKVTLVTGGNSGIGLGFARGIAKQGGDVVIWARSADRNDAAKKELESYGVKVTTQPVDVTSREQIIAGYEQLIADHGRIDCVFANSGRPSANQTQSVLNIKADDWYDLLALNLHGAFFTLQEGARQMVKRAEAGEPGGSLVACGSLTMFQSPAGIEDYAASKGAMGAVVRAMAVGLGKYGIRVNSLAPGFIKTEMLGPLDQELPIERHFASRTPIARMGYAKDFEAIAAYLCSDGSSYHTGDTIVIDGGSLINPSYA